MPWWAIEMAATAEYKRVILGTVYKCNFGVDKRVIEEIGQLLTLTSSPHLAADDTSWSVCILIGLHFCDYILMERWVLGRQLKEGVDQKCRWTMMLLALVWGSSPFLGEVNIQLGQNGSSEKCTGQTPWICWLGWHPKCATTQGQGQVVVTQSDYWSGTVCWVSQLREGIFALEEIFTVCF